ncbi:hypothetical protein R0131_14075 [Clostridium sp. AL.422]|uniref:hypothetical protein n=1 Tax=Clostridium TaxID=1485 RepID=UPI00293DCFE4|nr:MULTISPECIES: hypothetical protein [unclassified Clostridium]MDV4151951.1 hypothetical protein [Clostridium sp. AL.422]
MAYRHLMNNQYNEVNNLTTLLNSLVNSYRLLIGGAYELNNISEAKKGDVKDAVKRADDLGEIIDEIIRTLDECNTSYIKYCKIKKSFIDEKSIKDNILTEINNEIEFKNSSGREDEED